MNNSTREALNIVFQKKYDPANPSKSLKHLLSSTEYFQTGKDKTIIFQNDPVNYVYILIKGKVSVVNSVSWGFDRIVDYIEPLQIVGLVEYLNNIPLYTAHVITEIPCTFIRIAIDKYIKMIQEDAMLCYYTLVIMGESNQSNMNTSELKSLIHPRDMLGHHLFQRALDQGIPYTYPRTRIMLAEELHVNLRTLYRYLSYLKTGGYIEIVRGKININEQNMKAMEKRYKEIIL